MAKRSRPGFSGWLAANAVVVLTVAGAAFYVALRLAYRTFYGRLGLTPEDVGLSYGDAVARAAGIALYFAVFFAGVVGAPVLAIRIVKPSGGWVKPFMGIAAVTSAVALFAGLLVVMWATARSQARLVQDGKTVRPPFLFDTGTRAHRASVKWVGDAPVGLSDVQTHRLMYLGESGGSVVLYDVDEKRSLRLPAGEVVVSIRP
jgi:hypothetical protein